jgi:hypothetical protein
METSVPTTLPLAINSRSSASEYTCSRNPNPSVFYTSKNALIIAFVDSRSTRLISVMPHDSTAASHRRHTRFEIRENSLGFRENSRLKNVTGSSGTNLSRESRDFVNL